MSVDEVRVDGSFRWNIRLLKNRNPFVVVILAAALCGGAAGLALFRSLPMALLGFAMILAATADYWMGAKYLVDANGAQAKVGLSLTSMQWKDVKRVIVEPGAVKLSPLGDGQRLDAFRGVVLRTDSKVRSQVLDLIDRYAPSEATVQHTEKETPR
jgi:hypothetical protein